MGANLLCPAKVQGIWKVSGWAATATYTKLTVPISVQRGQLLYVRHLVWCIKTSQSTENVQLEQVIKASIKEAHYAATKLSFTPHIVQPIKKLYPFIAGSQKYKSKVICCYRQLACFVQLPRSVGSYAAYVKIFEQAGSMTAGVNLTCKIPRYQCNTAQTFGAQT